MADNIARGNAGGNDSSQSARSALDGWERTRIGRMVSSLGTTASDNFENIEVDGIIYTAKILSIFPTILYIKDLLSDKVLSLCYSFIELCYLFQIILGMRSYYPISSEQGIREILCNRWCAGSRRDRGTRNRQFY